MRSAGQDKAVSGCPPTMLFYYVYLYFAMMAAGGRAIPLNSHLHLRACEVRLSTAKDYWGFRPTLRILGTEFLLTIKLNRWKRKLPMKKLPIPPIEMRALVGPTDEASFDNPQGEQLFDAERIFDFGCGCGRMARRLMLQKQPPKEYLGVDLHAGMIRWARDNLTAQGKNFQFEHLDVYNVALNPSGEKRFEALPGKTRHYDLVVAHSVFTHILQEDIEAYLHEISRILVGHGKFTATFFTFDRSDFPMLQDFQNALYINWSDPTNATIFDRGWLKETAAKAGLIMTAIQPPAVRGYHWSIEFGHKGAAKGEVEWPSDSLLLGHVPPPMSPKDAERIGLGVRPRRLSR